MNENGLANWLAPYSYGDEIGVTNNFQSHGLTPLKLNLFMTQRPKDRVFLKHNITILPILMTYEFATGHTPWRSAPDNNLMLL